MILEAGANHQLDQLKYYSQQCGIDYKSFTYNSGLSLSRSLDRCDKLRDLDGCKYTLQRFNKKYPEDLYPGEYGDSINLAANLHDLFGIHYLNNKFSQIHINMYEMINFRDVKEQMIFAIKLGDTEGIKHVCDVNSLTHDEVLGAIKFAYYKEKLEVAEPLVSFASSKFISKKAILNKIITGIIRSNSALDKSSYEGHISVLEGQESEVTMKAVLSLLQSMFIQKDQIQTLSVIKADIYDEAANVQAGFNNLNFKKVHFTVRDVINFVTICTYEGENIDIFSPNHSVESVSPFYSAFQIENVSKNHRIYIPKGNDISLLIHELSHFLLYSMFNNLGYPYYSSGYEMYESYKSAAKLSLSNMLTVLVGHSSYNDAVKLICGFTRWHIGKKQSENLTNALYSKFFHNQDNNVAFNFKIERLSKIYVQMTEHYEWDEEKIYVLDRMCDYFRRYDEELDAEFLVRIPELYYLELNSTLMENFSPAVTYWKEYISPNIEQLRNQHAENCKHQLRTNKSLNGCALHALEEKHSEDLWKLAIELECSTCFSDYIYDDKIFVDSISYQKRKELLEYTAEKISYCVNYCTVAEDCREISSHSLLGGFFKSINIVTCKNVNPEGPYENAYEEIIHQILQYDDFLTL